MTGEGRPGKPNGLGDSDKLAQGDLWQIDDGLVVGDTPDSVAQAMFRAHLRTQESEIAFLDRTRPHFDRKTIASKLDDLLEQADYKPAHGRWHLSPKALGNFAIRKGEALIGYREILDAAEAKSGKSEAATFGTAHFGDQECVVFAMNWDFMGASVGQIVGEKGIEAVKLARQRKLPLVPFYTSGGMRQHESAYALAQMQRAQAELLQYLHDTDLPHISVLFGQIWGGTSASTALLADTVIGVAGSDFGFAGGRVIENYQKKPVEPGVQSVETNYLNRFIDVIVPYEELNEYLGEHLRVGRPAQHVSKANQVPAGVQDEIWHLKNPKGQPWKLAIGAEGMAPALKHNQAVEGPEFPPRRFVDPDLPEADALLAGYENLISDAGRPDGDYLIQSVFDSAIPLYNHYVRDESVIFPPIVAALARIDNQPFMVIANQPSYKVYGDTIRKVLATPGPRDYEYVTRLMGVAARRALPVVTLTDTLGASPTVESELLGQSKRITDSMRALIEHPRPVISIITGALGSGGGLGTTLLGETKALEDAQIYVAEPGSAASILHKTQKPEIEQTKEILSGMDASAAKLRELGFLGELIQLGADRTETAYNIRKAIQREFEQQDGKSEHRLRKARDQGLQNLRRDKILDDDGGELFGRRPLYRRKT